MEYKYMACPHCHKAVRQGIRRFGPAQAICAWCGEKFATGLKDWNTMAWWRKLWHIFLEWFFPSYFRGFPLFPLLLVLPAYWMCVAIPVVLIEMDLREFTLSQLIYHVSDLFWVLLPPLLALRLFKMIYECIRYHRTGAMPRWKKRFYK